MNANSSNQRMMGASRQCQSIDQSFRFLIDWPCPARKKCAGDPVGVPGVSFVFLYQATTPTTFTSMRRHTRLYSAHDFVEPKPTLRTKLRRGVLVPAETRHLPIPGGLAPFRCRLLDDGWHLSPSVPYDAWDRTGWNCTYYLYEFGRENQTH